MPAPPSASVPQTPDVAPPTAPPSPPLGTVLGLAGCRNFLLQHQLLTEGRSYRVLNHEKRHLFTVTENVRQELMANFMGRAQQPQMGLSMGFVAPAPHTYAWSVDDAAGNAQGGISVVRTGNHSVSTLTGLDGVPVLAVQMEHGMMGGFKATAVLPDGRAMYETHGNLLRRSFLIRDPGGREVAKVHEAFASIRDTYNLDMMEGVDPLAPLIFGILIDREKEATSGTPQRR